MDVFLMNREVFVLPIVLLIILSVPSNAAVSSIIEGAIYVHPNDSSCSELLNSTTNCSTLACYTREENIRKYFTSNTKMVFLSGVHRLCGNPQISSVQNFTMIASEDATFANNEGVPEPHSIIECQYGGGAGFHFSNSSNIQLHGLTFNSCGANFTIYHDFPVFCALCFEGLHNVNITQLVTHNTTGFGIHFDNTEGTISVIDSAFLWSTAIPDQDTRGGNARFYFSESHNLFCPTVKTNIVIKSSWFMYGNDRSKIFSGDHNNSPGLTIFIRCPSIHMHIDNITAANNTGENGGNIAITLTDFFENPSRVTIRNSHIRHGIAYKGGGLRMWSFYEPQAGKTKACTYRKNEIVNILNTEFLGNQANNSAGAVHIDHYESIKVVCNQHQVVFTNCSFISNFISLDYSVSEYFKDGGAALKIAKHRNEDYQIHTTPQFAVKLDQCNFTHNYISGFDRKEGAVLDIFGIGNITISECNFCNNNGTALSVRRSNVIFSGSIHFINNSAAYGGALKLCDSSLLYLEHNTSVYFIGNQANFTGGAIYAEQPCLDTAPACFFQFIVPGNNNIPVTVESLKNSTILVFKNNSALVAGDAIYGGAIEFCHTFRMFSIGKQNSKFYSKEIFNATFNLTGQTGFSKVSSDPNRICLCTNNEPDCVKNHNNEAVAVYPGQEFNISIVAVGQMNGMSPAHIGASLIEGQTHSHKLHTYDTSVQPANHSYRYRCNTIKYSILSNKSNTNISFSLQISGSSDTGSINNQHQYPNVSVSILPCPWGFALTRTPPYKCDCDPLIQKYDVQCDIDTQTIHIHGHRLFWIGNQTTTNGSTKLILLEHCDYPYCNEMSQNITLSTTRLQCNPGHTGVMCKSCSPGYTLALGTSHCLKNCSNKNAAWLLVVCLLSGILLVVVLSACNITMTEGTINGLIFYANIVHLNHDIFFKKDTVTINFFRIFIAWLNLDFGFEVCFYKHLDAYQKVWLQFGFVLYIWIVQWFIVILSRNFVFFTRLVGRNVVKVMATLFLLCYTKVVRYAVFAFQFARLYNSTPYTYSIVWFHDGSIQYLKGKHIVLFVVAIVLSLLMLFFTLVLLFIQFLQKQTEYRCLRWINRLRPFFDASTGCCKDHYRFWPGLLYFMRGFLCIANSVAEIFHTQRAKSNVMLGGIIGVSIMILVIACVTPRGVYKKWRLNILEFSFILNLCILCIVQVSNHHVYKVYFSVPLTMLTFVGILIYHTYKKFKTSRVRRALVNWNTRRQLRLNQTVNNDTGALRCQVEVANDIVGQESDCEASDERKANEATPLLRQEMPPVIRFDQYREPLLTST